MACKRHKHEFTALYWHFGPFGDQDVHVHSCFGEDCDRVLVGTGRRCDPRAPHRRVTLDGSKVCDLDSLSPDHYVRDRWGWHRVVRVNAKSVTVETTLSGNERISRGKIIETRAPVPKGAAA